MHLDISVITLTTILPHVSIMMATNSAFLVYLSLLFRCTPLIYYDLQPTVAANDRLLISCDHILLQLGTYWLYKHALNTDDRTYTCIGML